MARHNSAQARTQALFLKLDKIACETRSGASPETVHDLRTTARRVEMLLSVHGLDKHGATAKLARQLAKLRRRAGKLRDIDVHIAALDYIRLENGAPEKLALQKHLAQLRKKSKDKLMRTLQKEVTKGFVQRLKRAAKKLEAQSTQAGRAEYTTQALAKFKALVQRSWHLSENTLHDFRIDCKRIRYLAEMSAGAPGTKRVISAFKSIQDTIGDWHDWLTLSEVAKEVVPKAASALIAALRAQTRLKLNEALRVTAEATRTLLAVHSQRVQLLSTTRISADTNRRKSDRRARPGRPLVASTSAATAAKLV